MFRIYEPASRKADAGHRARPPPVEEKGSAQVVPQQDEMSRRKCDEIESLLQTDVGSSPTVGAKNPVHISGRDFYLLPLTSSLLPKLHSGFFGK